VNRAILEGLERLSQSFANFSGPDYYQAEEQDERPEESGEVDNGAFINIQEDLDGIANPAAVDTPDATAENANESSILDYGNQLDIDSDVKGPKINEKVATVINKLCLQRISQDQSKIIMKLHNTPENIKVRLTKCEQSIWNQMPGKVRINDVKFQTTQAMLLSSINCQLKVSESLLKMKADKETITSCLDGLTMAMTANFELNNRRRDSIKPQFKSEFAKGLCSSSNPADEFLFGGDTAKRVKEIAELNKSRVCKYQSAPRGRGQRFSPYSSRGYRSDSTRSRGRGFRGRSNQWSYGNRSSYQQSQHFQNAPQSEKRSGSKSTQYWYVNLEKDIRTLINNQPPFVAGQTKNCTLEWHKITSDPEILDYIEHCHIEFIDDPCKYSGGGQRNFSAQQRLIITTELAKLLQLEVIGLSEHEMAECLSPIFVTHKPDG